ncbi:MAG: DUF4097 family beta strand repeat protein [Acidobacteria bacterium]|nr:DUF4097 family beta strand repeat protein [Acidobacteriota bacterium]MBV9475568.1 DUF4097 family beta strand repeat protein [Acidobacteriota bacterium]
MKHIIAAAFTLLVATAASAATLEETIDKTFDVKPGASLVLTNVNGRVTVSAWDQPRVHVVALKKVEADRDDVQAAMRELRVELQPRDGGLVVTTHYPKRGDNGGVFDWLFGDHVEAQVRYEVMVPRSMNVDVTNTNGAIELSGVTGRHELDTTNGGIEVKACAGSLDASTTNGSVHAELTSVAANQPVHLETTNGRIELAVPRNFGAEVDASTTNGSIKTDLPVLTTETGRNSLRGKINGGGTRVRLRTTNGGISIRSLT